MSGTQEIRRLEQNIIRVETILIVLAICAIAWGDHYYGKSISLGYLYLIPLSYSALTHSLRVTLMLVTLCVILREISGPLELSPWSLIIRDWLLTAIYLALVTKLQRLGRARREFFETARHQRDELVEEIELAAEVQRNLLDKHVPPSGSLEIIARTVPAKVVGGDYFDFFRTPGGKLAIVIADVAGKGLPAALLMPAVQISLRALAARDLSIEQMLAELNTVLVGALEDARYSTLWIGLLDEETGDLTCSNAGHQPPLLLKFSGEAVWLEEGGPPVGLLGDASYQKQSLKFEPGDLLIVYTDGVTESENAAEEMFGRDRVLGLARSLSASTPDRIVEEIHRQVVLFREGRGGEDDVTVIVAKLPKE